MQYKEQEITSTAYSLYEGRGSNGCHRFRKLGVQEASHP